MTVIKQLKAQICNELYGLWNATCANTQIMQCNNLLRNSKHVSIKLEKDKWKFGRTRNAVGTQVLL